MADVTIDELIERTRLESGLRNNAYYDTDQILRSLNAGGAELQDLFTAANQKYIISEFDFTTTGSDDAIVELPDDFQQGHSLDIFPDVLGQTRTIRYLSNWLDRNAGNGVFSLGPGGWDPVYTFMGGNLRFYPPQCVPAAPFRLYYTPMWQDLAAEVTREFEADAFDLPIAGGPMSVPCWSLANADFTDADVDSVLTPDLEAPNTAWNIPYVITEVFSGTLAAATPSPLAIGSYTQPSAGSFTIVGQPAGTRSTLPAMYRPWSEYLVVYAAMAINIDRQRPIGELERKLQALKLRIASILDNRQEEPQQPPLSRGAGGTWGGGGRGGGWL